jgi:hypothetical protein
MPTRDDPPTQSVDGAVAAMQVVIRRLEAEGAAACEAAAEKVNVAGARALLQVHFFGHAEAAAELCWCLTGASLFVVLAVQVAAEHAAVLSLLQEQLRHSQEGAKRLAERGKAAAAAAAAAEREKLELQQGLEQTRWASHKASFCFGNCVHM